MEIYCNAIEFETEEQAAKVYADTDGLSLESIPALPDGKWLSQEHPRETNRYENCITFDTNGYPGDAIVARIMQLYPDMKIVGYGQCGIEATYEIVSDGKSDDATVSWVFPSPISIDAFSIFSRAYEPDELKFYAGEVIERESFECDRDFFEDVPACYPEFDDIPDVAIVERPALTSKMRQTAKLSSLDIHHIPSY